MLALAVVLATATPAIAADRLDGSDGSAGSDTVVLGCELADTRVQLTASAALDPSCVWTAGFDITASDVVLDCQGAVVRGAGGGRGIEISTPIDVDLHNVTVRRCRVEGFLNSVRATRVGFRTLAEGEEYDHELADVVLEDNEFRDSVGVGVFVDGYVSRVTIRDNLITGTGSAGIYLETGSRRNVVDGNTIVDNGFRENGPGGQVEEIAGIRFRWWGAGREGLAIDGSWENVVTGNHFEGNSHGGILLYTNCGEFPDSGRWFDRRWPADRNLIEDNTFVGGLNGVWVGQRMAENTYPMECTKPPYVTGVLRSITLDFAADNVVRANHFDGVTYAIRVEDDGTIIDDNTIVGDRPDQHAVVIGTPDRTEVLDRPVARTRLIDNHATITGNPDPFRWIHGYDGLQVPRQPLGRSSCGHLRGRTASPSAAHLGDRLRAGAGRLTRDSATRRSLSPRRRRAGTVHRPRHSDRDPGLGPRHRGQRHPRGGPHPTLARPRPDRAGAVVDPRARRAGGRDGGGRLHAGIGGGRVRPGSDQRHRERPPARRRRGRTVRAARRVVPQARVGRDRRVLRFGLRRAHRRRAPERLTPLRSPTQQPRHHPEREEVRRNPCRGRGVTEHDPPPVLPDRLDHLLRHVLGRGDEQLDRVVLGGGALHDVGVDPAGVHEGEPGCANDRAPP